MATIASPQTDLVQHERRFFFAMSLLLIASALLGFGYFQYAGISSWGAPWFVHLHAFSQMGWLGFYALQNWLVMRGDVAMHRKLGVFGIFYAGWLLLAGLNVAYLAISTGRNDGTIPTVQLTALNLTNLATFAVLFIAAIFQRKRSDWHKRLMLSAVIVLSVPSLGRILIMLGIPSTVNRALFVLAYMAIGMGFDWRTRGAIHPAWFWGAGAAIAMGLTIGGLTDFQPFIEFANGLAG